MASVQSDPDASPKDTQLTVSCPSDIARYIESEIASGSYSSESELVQDAIRQLRDRNFHSLKEALQIGIDEIERGECYEINNKQELTEFFEDLWHDVELDFAKKQISDA